ncbi:MAG: hypothetical protein JOY62_08120 [Acidobacteriaceae bacterium]|nr:hypothetical protein [Acidobacteriaceae bacterium]MBV9779926.1 hypothetical protein [Acidobacteriaceae bacterium]
MGYSKWAGSLSSRAGHVRPLRHLVVMVGLCCVTIALQGQTDDWQAVEKLAPGTSISIVKRVRQGCELVKVTDAQLACDRHIGQDERALVFARDEVREVRLEEPEDNRVIAGAIIGAAAGGLIGFAGGSQARDPEARGYARVYGIPLGAVIGGLIGHSIHRHGAVVYRRR